MVAAANLYSNARDLITYLRAHLSSTGHQPLDQAFTAVNRAWYQQKAQAQNIAWVTDRVAGQQITYQVGYNGNAIVVLQTAFNWSNYN